MLLAALLLGAAADAASPEVWAALHNGRMLAALEQDPAQAAEVYEVLLDHLTEENEPLRDELLYWLGQARFEAGDIEGAIEALAQARSPEAVTLRELIAVWSEPVESLPYLSAEDIALTSKTSWRLILEDVEPSVLSLKLRAEEGAALLLLSLTDLEGRRWEKEILELADGAWQEITIDFDDLRPADETTGSPGRGLWMIAITPAAPLQGRLHISEVELN